MLLIHKIEKTHFSSSEALIIQCILDLKQDIKDLSSYKIADLTHTSPTLVIRVAKKLGLSGWNELKEIYLKELEYLYKSYDTDASIPFTINDDFVEISHHIASLQKDAITETQKLLDHDTLYKAMRYLRDAKEIDVFTRKCYRGYAKSFQESMFFINKKVNVYSYFDEVYARCIEKGHVVIGISYSGENENLLKIQDLLVKKHIPFIAITNVGNNQLSLKADVVLKMSSREMLTTKIGDFATSQSVKYLLDTIYSCIFSLDYKHSLDRRLSLSSLQNEKVSGFEYIDEKE